MFLPRSKFHETNIPYDEAANPVYFQLATIYSRGGIVDLIGHISEDINRPTVYSLNNFHQWRCIE